MKNLMKVAFNDCFFFHSKELYDIHFFLTMKLYAKHFSHLTFFLLSNCFIFVPFYFWRETQEPKVLNQRSFLSRSLLLFPLHFGLVSLFYMNVNVVKREKKAEI